MSIVDTPLEYVEIWRSRSKGRPIVWENSSGEYSDQDPCTQIISNAQGKALYPLFQNNRNAGGRNVLFALRPDFLILRVEPKTGEYRVLRIEDQDVYEEFFSEKSAIVRGTVLYKGNINQVTFAGKVRYVERKENVLPEGFEKIIEAAKQKEIRRNEPIFFLTREEFDKVLQLKQERSAAPHQESVRVAQPGERSHRPRNMAPSQAVAEAAGH